MALPSSSGFTASSPLTPAGFRKGSSTSPGLRSEGGGTPGSSSKLSPQQRLLRSLGGLKASRPRVT
jgi:hypothetical protein